MNKRPSLREMLSTKKELDENVDADLDFKDYLAMSIALGSYVFPVLIGIFGMFALIAWLMFGR